MPYEIKRDSRCPKSKPFGVMKKGGGKMHGCHPSQAAARKQMAALYVAESKKEVVDELEEKAIGEPEAAEVDTHEKMMDMPRYVPYGVTSFEELRTAREADEATLEMHSLAGDLQGLLGNRISEIMMDEETDDKAAAIITSLKELAEELADMVQAEADMAGEEEKEAEIEEDDATLFGRFKEWLGKTVPQGSRPPGSRGVPREGIKPADDKRPIEPSQELGFMAWKEADGSYRWMARYSNNFRDQDNPSEIISSKSHQRFDELLSKGEAPPPELWLWHRPEWRWGTTTWHAYDNSGFALAAGTVNKEAEALAEHLMALDPALVRVSHGMPTKSIVRDADDPSVIVEHITREISPLPAWAAANQHTGFIILKEMNDMAIPQDKRDALKTEWNLSNELLTQLEAANAADAKQADEAGVEKKEIEKASLGTPGGETTQPPAEVVAEAASEPEPAIPDGGVSRGELREALLAIGQAIATLSGQVKELQGQVVEVKEHQEIEEAGTLSEIFERAIKRPETLVKKSDKAAKDRPAETKTTPAVVNSGHPLADQVINSIVSGEFLAGLQGPQQPQ